MPIFFFSTLKKAREANLDSKLRSNPLFKRKILMVLVYMKQIQHFWTSACSPNLNFSELEKKKIWKSGKM
jgi:hypothetical protein